MQTTLFTEPSQSLHGDTRRVLAVSASDRWREDVRAALSDSVLQLSTASSLDEALASVTKSEPAYSAVIVNSVLEDSSGIGLCRALRESRSNGDVPILIVSALSSEFDRILAFENGADDFLAYPFFARELASRVRAVLRRHAPGARSDGSHPAEDFGGLDIDIERSEVNLEGTRVRLTTREFEVLKMLVEREGRVVARSDLLRGVPAEGASSLRVVDTHVKAIRRKLGRARHCIETVRGVGYRFSRSDPPEG